ncbi:hypothetical protein RB195_023041 [Necator americanus]|uniref:Uncharacterized protein n=1 Tax=Necator americanus TaxID=51031 RepID=A0ABR1EHM6_NECAM
MGLEACNLPMGFKFYAKHSNRKESPDSGGKPARTLESDAAIEDLMMQARKFKYDVIGLTETRRRHPLTAMYDTGENLFLETYDSRGTGGVGVLVNTFDNLQPESDVCG